MKGGRYVVDASVAIKLFIDEPFSEQAEVLFSILKDDAVGEFYVPDLFFIECTNVFWKHIKRFGYSEEKACEDLLVRLHRFSGEDEPLLYGHPCFWMETIPVKD